MASLFRTSFAVTAIVVLVCLPALASAAACASTTNVAPLGTASQSSTWYDAVAAKAIDGNTEGNASLGFVAHTQQEANAWWKVTFATNYTISEIKLYPRTDCCQDRLSLFTLSLYSGGQLTFQLQQGPPVTSLLTLPIADLYADTIEIKLDGTNYLSVAEVEAQGCPATVTQPSLNQNPVIVAASFGDPHVMTLDGMAVTYLACGDHVMLRNPEIGMEYHARHCLVGAQQGSSTCGIALRCEKDAPVIELTAGADDHLLLGKKKTTISSGATLKAQAGVQIRNSEIGWTVSCGSGFQLLVRRRSSPEGEYLDAFATAPETFRNKVSGLLGNFDGHKHNDVAFCSHGKKVELGLSEDQDYISTMEQPELDHVQESWKVHDEDHIFSTVFDKKTCPTASRRQMLSETVNDQALLEVARRICESHGLTGRWHAMCVVDVLSFQSPKAASAAAQNAEIFAALQGSK